MPWFVHGCRAASSICDFADRQSQPTRTGGRTKKKAQFLGPLRDVFGRGERIRTSDPSVPNRVLYQAEPRPDRAKRYLNPDATVNATVPFAVARVSRSRTCTSSSYRPGGNGFNGTVCAANACDSHAPAGGRSASENCCGDARPAAAPGTPPSASARPWRESDCSAPADRSRSPRS